MKISTKGRYGLRALIDIAQYSEIEPVPISSISARQDISERYLEQLMALLKRAGLIKSIRGAGRVCGFSRRRIMRGSRRLCHKVCLEEDQ